MSENDAGGSGLDRRSMIKRAGIVSAGVAAWSSPSVTNLASAFAAASPSPGCPSCGLPNNTCGGQVPCAGSACFCTAKVDGSGCLCHVSTSCGSLQTCTTQADCPSGTFCGLSCCSGARCLPLCDGGSRIAARVGADVEMSGPS